MNLSIPNLIKRGEVYYFKSRVPEDLRRRGILEGQEFVRVSLKTKDIGIASRECQKMTEAYEALWLQIRSEGKDLSQEQVRQSAERLLASWGAARHDLNPYVETAKLNPETREKVRGYLQRKYKSSDLKAIGEKLTAPEAEAIARLSEDPRSLLFSEIAQQYMGSHPSHAKQDFILKNQQAVKLLIEAAGDLPLARYSKDSMRRVKAHVLDGRKTQTARRLLCCISSAFNYGLDQYDLPDVGNPFKRIKIEGEGKDAAIVPPFTEDELALVASAAVRDQKWLVCMLIETGARIAEIAGLRTEDVFIEGEAIPYIHIRDHADNGRGLKTRNSERRVSTTGPRIEGRYRTALSIL